MLQFIKGNKNKVLSCFTKQKTYKVNNNIACDTINVSSSKNVNGFGMKTLFRVITLSGILISYSYASGKADDYIRASATKLFDDTSKLECMGSERSAICTINGNYDIAKGNIKLYNYRHTVDYKDTRVIERISGNFQVLKDSNLGVYRALKTFLPSHFECSNFQQIHNDKQQVNDQFVCYLYNNSYQLKVRLRTKAYSSFFSNIDSMGLLQKSETLFKILSQSYDEDYEYSYTEPEYIEKILNNIDVSLYGIDIAITMPNLSQKIYKYVYSHSRYYDTFEGYHSDIGEKYGYLVGNIWSSNKFNKQTKESLVKLFSTLRDSLMLDSNINTIYITVTNKNGTTFNFGDAYRYIATNPSKDMGDTLYNGSVLNNYRIDVGVTRMKEGIK